MIASPRPGTWWVRKPFLPGPMWTTLVHRVADCSVEAIDGIGVFECQAEHWHDLFEPLPLRGIIGRRFRCIGDGSIHTVIGEGPEHVRLAIGGLHASILWDSFDRCYIAIS
jgi:hypothetical protein